MAIKIVRDNYGKSRIRLLKVARGGDRHEIQNLTLNITLEGDFEAIQTTGDNSLCLPTDTMKNTVYALAGQVHEIESVETFGQRLAKHFLDNNAHVSLAKVRISETIWKRMKFDGERHSHSFLKCGGEIRIANITADRDGVVVEAGVEELVVLKTAGSAFEGYIRDELETPRETTDRIFSTAIQATWRYSEPEGATDELFRSIRQTILRVFAEHDSSSVQHTLYAIAEAVLEAFVAVEEISFSLPNIHCLPVEVSGFGLEESNSIFVPTGEPHGLIEATFKR